MATDDGLVTGSDCPECGEPCTGFFQTTSWLARKLAESRDVCVHVPSGIRGEMYFHD